MHHPAVKHTLSIFQRIYDNLPPLVPGEIILDLEQKLKAVYENHEISLDELENIMIVLGKQVWPYIQAFEELYIVYEEKLGEKLFQQRASQSVKKKFSLFKQMGGSLQDMYHGRVHEIFDYSERIELVELFVGLKHDIRKHAMQAVLSHDFEKYTNAVEKYGRAIEEINIVLRDLRQMASKTEHPDIVQDMHDKARTIEHSLIYLGPKISIDEIRGVVEYYIGKKHEKMFHV